MLKKIICTALALALAWGLGNILYEIWMSGQIYQTARNRGGSEYSYSSDHARFLAFFFLKALVALCGVLLLLALGWTEKRPAGKASDHSGVTLDP